MGNAGDGVEAGTAAGVIADLCDRLAAAAAAGGPDDALRADLAARTPEIVDAALPADTEDPYSRLVLHAGDGVEVMVARWRPSAGCAPHDHGGSSGFVTALTGGFAERRYGWDGSELAVVAELDHPVGDVFAFGPDVVHDMTSGPDGGVTFHVYAPAPTHMHVYDLDEREVLDLHGDFGAWIPTGDHPRVPFADAAAAAGAAQPADGRAAPPADGHAAPPANGHGGDPSVSSAPPVSSNGSAPDSAGPASTPPAPPAVSDREGSYDKVAALYDQAYVDITVREAEWAWVQGRVEALRRELGRPLRFAEIGCGNGALLRELDEGGHVSSALGLDESDAVVARAIERTGDQHPSLRFARIDGSTIPLDDESVDVVVSFLSWRYLDWPAVSAEIRRVLAPGGRLWVVDMVSQALRLSELPLFARSAWHHLRVPKRHPQFARDVAALTSHPDWKAMLAQNPAKTEAAHKAFLEGEFRQGRVEVLTVTRTQRVVAFDSGPLPEPAASRA